ncbi:acyl-CoA dehydrogenase family protein [Ochrobactrum sp. Marseille-Q0166]|uniref:acyl-CoA dehydrogenase family protein n=1 Tax=Ochrobactrum sp. Marseille-Q0166 TaxID=2761105 RepID=UPI0016563B31|nr:acyl-CoA dehydrogenase family protein [Ochrobactrum sp. Marseille-Q0166]
MKTHEVTNQTPSMTGTNAYLGDPLLIQIAARFPKELHTDLENTGRFVMSAEAQDLARLANTELPKLRTHDRQGRRVDLVEYHPAYHALMRRSIAQGLHCSIWEANPAEAGRRHQARAARFFLSAQLEAGHLCPLTMTNASLAALMASPDLYKEWSPQILSRRYDSSQKPALQKQGITLGMGMTEKQGGTDVRANTTRAERYEDGTYTISGHKWFMSAPMSDAFLVLAQAEEGLSCFLLPRLADESAANGFFFQRLKDKLGNKSNASSEVEFDGAIGHLVGNPGEGVKTIMDMVTLTRLDCAVASAGLMRSGLAEAVHHARHREVGGQKLIEQPLMSRVLADMALDVAGATALSMRLARAFDMAASDRAEAAFARCMTPVVKYWVCKIAPALLYEAMECLGGNGYIEDGNLARAYREAPVNAIWEGSGNVMALDVARVLSRAPALFDEVLDWISGQLGVRGQGTIDVLQAALQLTETDQGVARLLTEQLAYAAAAAELRNLGADDVADAFIETRLGGQWRSTYGMLDARHNANRIIDQLYPAS